VSWSIAASALWPQLTFGIYVCGSLAVISPMALLWSLPLTAGFLLAVPFAVLTANPAVGGIMRRHGVAAIPEDFATPTEIHVVQSGGEP
jgi:membrane glycosyltransferase